MESVQIILNRLKESGISDEKLAVAIGEELPGSSNPSSVSVRRWRTGKNQPSAVYDAAIREYAQGQEGNE